MKNKLKFRTHGMSSCNMYHLSVDVWMTEINTYVLFISCTEGTINYTMNHFQYYQRRLLILSNVCNKKHTHKKTFACRPACPYLITNTTEHRRTKCSNSPKSTTEHRRTKCSNSQKSTNINRKLLTSGVQGT